MYDLPYFKEPDEKKVLQFMREHPFAMLIGCAGNVPVATQVPLLLEDRSGKTFLKGHIMRSTDHHHAFEKNGQVLCVFSGAHTYVSASWYANPQTGSTWNYRSVHARGTLTFLTGDALIAILKETTTHFENDIHSPASFENLSDDYVQRLANAIIGFEIEVTGIDNVFKLSQNRDAESYDNIVDKLRQGDAGAQAIAEEMKARASQLFHAP